MKHVTNKGTHVTILFLFGVDLWFNYLTPNTMKKLILLLPVFLLFSLFSQPVAAQTPNLGTAGDFALFTTVGAVTNTGNSFITGNVGTNSGAITGFGNVNGVVHAPDGATLAAEAELIIAHALLISIPNTGTHAPALANETFTAGVYGISGNSVLNGNLTLDAQNNPNAVFIFKIAGTFATTSASTITLINGAQSCNVFWTVEGMVSIANQTIMRGTVIANNAAIDLASDVVIDGRVLSTGGAITLLNSSAKIPTGCGRPVLTGPIAPDLKTAACYAVFSSIGEVTNAGISYVKGDIGTNSGLTTGYNALNVNGIIHPIPDTYTAAAAADLTNAYTYLNTLPYDIELLFPAQFGNDLVLTPHTYLMNAATSLIGNVYLNGEGNADAVFVIQITGALSTSTFAKVILTNGTQAKNVYWKVDGAVNISDYSEIKGTFIVNNAAIDLATGVNMEGRVLSTSGLVTTNAATINSFQVCAGPLPVTWLYFQGKAVKQKVVLEWATTGEKNNHYFILEKSTDAINFIELARVNAEIKDNVSKQVYTFTDEKPNGSTYYRISQIDIDGRKELFNNIINVKLDKNQNFEVKHIINGNTIYIQTKGAATGNGTISLFNLDGRKVASQQILLSGDKNSYQVNQSLSKGIYILTISAQNEKLFSEKIVIR